MLDLKPFITTIARMTLQRNFADYCLKLIKILFGECDVTRLYICT